MVVAVGDKCVSVLKRFAWLRPTSHSISLNAKENYFCHKKAKDCFGNMQIDLS